MSRPTARTTYYGPVAVALVGALVGAALLVGERDRTDQDAQSEAARAAAHAVLPVSRALEEQRDQASMAPASARRLVAVDDADAPSAAVAALARDTGEPVFDDRLGGAVVVARYDPPAPTSVADRRTRLVGFSVTPLDLETALAPFEGAAALQVLGPQRRVVGAAPSEQGVTFDLAFDDAVAPGWRLRATTAPAALSWTAWLVAIAITLLGLLASVVVFHRSARSGRLRDELRRRAHSDGRIAELAVVAQSSLDLGEVLPASFALLEEALDLRGLSLVGSGRPTFVWRDAPTDDEAIQPPRAPVAAGECVEVPLARGGRSLGSLRVRAGRELDELDRHTLTLAAETLSSSIANADAYDHQRSLVTRMRRLDDLKTVFVATASHELRTPVAAVVGYASMLTEHWEELDADTGLHYAQRVENSARRLVALVESLLDFARLEQGRAYQEEKEPLDLGVEICTLLENQPDITPDHELQVDVREGLVVSGSRLAIERVAGNLIGNAAKYAPAGTTIRVAVEGDAENARLVVDDQGPGVPPQEREQIFSRFFRGAGDAVTRTQGAGLGLSIVTEFARFMDGSVQIDEAPGGGTRFVVTYPLHQRPAAPPPQNRGEVHVLA